VLAARGRLREFTVGRNIEWEKVREIYRVAGRHGMKLAAIFGSQWGPFSEADVRQRAQARAGQHVAKAAGGRPPRPPPDESAGCTRRSRGGAPAVEGAQGAPCVQAEHAGTDAGSRWTAPAGARPRARPNARKSAVRKSA